MRSKLLATALLAAVLIVTGSPRAFAQTSKGDQARVGVPAVGAKGVQETVEQIMAREAATPPRLTPRLQPEHEGPDRQHLPQNPLSPARATWPALSKTRAERTRDRGPFAPQTLGTNFLGATLADTGAFPPDSMGAVGPTQFVVFVNGRVRTFTKATGLVDGVINADSDVFFASVMTPLTGGVVLNFTSDPQVRYDRLSGRWFLTIIDVPSSMFIGDTPNRLLIAVSDAASAGVLSAGTAWTFYFVQQNTVGGGDSLEFLDYPSLGVDANALYVGGNMFDAASGGFSTCSAFVIRKTSVLSGGPVVVTAFRDIITPDGPGAPRGVDNYNPASTEGYIVGPSVQVYGRLNLRRVSTPGGVPVLSADIPITVSTTSAPIPVDHFGNTGGLNGRLDSLDDRLFAAHIRNGRLWTAHNIAVTAAGVGASGAQSRDGVRWYELNVPVGAGTPTVVESGTIFDNAATLATARQFWIPSVMVSGQGHAALGFSTAGTPFRVDAATVGRLSGDTLGTTAGAPVLYTTSATAYNPPSDPGGGFGRRWGDYSFTSLDPNDDMTMWTIQEYCNAANSYGVRVVKLIAPPPATPNCAAPAQVTSPTQNVTIAGISSSGSGFFDPGAGFPNRLQASVTGGVTVNSVTYNNPTSVTLNVTATTNGLKNVTFTNPDGQPVTGTGCINVNFLADLSITKTDGQTSYGPAGSPITYTIVASNAGPSPVTGATVADTVPAGITGATWVCVGAGGGTCTASGSVNINDTVVNLPVGGSVTYTLSGVISASASGNLTNTATVTVPGGVTDPNLANNSATDTDTPTPQADLSITKTDGQTTYGPAGSPIVYTIVASNAGPSPVIGATVADTLPAGITGATWVCAGAGGGTCTGSGSVNINDTVNLPVGGTVTYTLSGTISLAASGNLSNTATVTVPGGVTDPNLTNNSATDTDIASGQNYFTVPPCRVVDTRGGAPNGGPVLQGQQTRVFVVAGNCGIPSSAKAVSVNLAVTLSSAGGNVRLFPAGQPVPTVSSINYSAGQTRANNAVVTLDASGQIAAFVGQAAGTTVHLIIDVNGYFE